ncbi:hypothetical protein [Dyadobacter psychrotolerans]|uniref:GNAT family N-acetyltransferase n=1 Tax=Dyadobacter psychrotolerans TaxID=2541721 RepID=A0A4V2Z4Z5_9BACT|nr:hypothetical protein [Dyadobacter psychrotolerans]TDE18618.1 hypothetical protein E0F88_03510 [Dyadobacter psychrotolerans]
MLQCVTNWAKSIGITKVAVNTPATCYNPQTNALLSNSYISEGFSVTTSISNHYIPVCGTMYEKLISSSENRRLRKCVSAGFVCKIWEAPNVNVIYSFLTFCRKQKGYSLSISKNQLSELIDHFPEQLIVFASIKEDQIVSLSVTVRVTEGILYNFLSASLPDYATFSPSVLVLKTIYNYCQKEKISVLDLGSSLDYQGKEKESLIRFKENMGGNVTCKVSYGKVL